MGVSKYMAHGRRMSATCHYCSPTLCAKGEYSHIPFSATANFCTTALQLNVDVACKNLGRRRCVRATACLRSCICDVKLRKRHGIAVSGTQERWRVVVGRGSSPVWRFRLSGPVSDTSVWVVLSRMACRARYGVNRGDDRTRMRLGCWVGELAAGGGPSQVDER